MALLLCVAVSLVQTKRLQSHIPFSEAGSDSPLALMKSVYLVVSPAPSLDLVISLPGITYFASGPTTFPLCASGAGQKCSLWR